MCHIRSRMAMGVVNCHAWSQKIAGKGIGFPLIPGRIPYMCKDMVAQFMHQGKTASSGRLVLIVGNDAGASILKCIVGIAHAHLIQFIIFHF